MKHTNLIFLILSILSLSLACPSFAQEQNAKIYIGAGSPMMFQIGYEKGWFDLSASYVGSFTSVTTDTTTDPETFKEIKTEEEWGPLNLIYLTPAITLALPVSDRFKIGIGVGTGLVWFKELEPEVGEDGKTKDSGIMWDIINLKISPRYYITPRIALFAQAGLHIFPSMMYAGAGFYFNL